MRRFAIKSIAFVLGFVALAVACAPLDSYSDIRIVGPKLAHIRSHPNDYDLIFFGSSYVHREFAPAVFDATLAERGYAMRSFNFGIPGMDPPETYFLAEATLDRAEPRLKAVLIELDYYRTGVRERNLHTRRNEYWHDAAFTTQALRATMTDSTPLGFRVKTAGRHVDAFVRNLLHAGRGKAYLLDAAGDLPDQSNWRAGLGPSGDGFTALDDRTTTRAELRGELFADFEADAFGERVESLKSGVAREGDTRRLTAAAIEALESIVRRVRSAGARPILVVPPCLDARAELIEYAREHVDADVVAFNDPVRFPALYDPSNRFDTGHLNHAGAIVFSRLLAEALAPILAPEQTT